MRLQVCVVGLLCSMMLTSPGSAATRFFNGGGTDSNWNTADNWSGGAAPTIDDVVIAGTENGKRALIDSSVNAATFVTMWSSPGAQALPDGFDMTGGTLNAGSKLVMGSNENNIPIEVNVSGGILNVAGFSTLGAIPGGTAPIDSPGTLNVSGTGQVNITTSLAVGSEHPDVASGGTLNLFGGGMMSVGSLSISTLGNGLVTLADNALLKIDGDVTADIDDHIAAGRIVGVNLGFDGQQTIVGVPEPSALVLLALGMVGLLGKRRR